MPNVRLLTRAITVIAVVGLGVTGCSSHPARTTHAASTLSAHDRAQVNDGQVAYMVSDPNGVMFIRWTRSGDVLTGSVDSSIRSQDVTGQHETLTGTQHGNTVALTVGIAQWTGTLDGDALTVHFPTADGSLQQLTLTPATIEDYNTAVQGLHDAADAQASATQAANEQANAQAAVTDADNALGRDLEAVTSAAATVRDSAVFTDELASMKDTLATMRADLATTVADAASDCSSAGGDAGTVEGDYGTLEGDQQTLEGSMQTLDAGLSTLNQALQDAKGDWAKLRAALAQATTANALNSQAGVDAAQAKTSYAASVAKKAKADARTKASALMATGRQLTAQANAAARRCS